MEKEIIEKAISWFKELLKLDTSNPPGSERAAIEFIAKELETEGLECQILAKDAERPNLFTKAGNSDNTKALLLSSHIDVAPADEASLWSFPPFSAHEHEGTIWGRGALDMKFKTAFDMALISTLKKEGNKLNRPVKMVVVSDEEAQSVFGTKYLVEEHRDLIDAEYVLNEHGGFNVKLNTLNLIPFQCGEKGRVHLRVHTQGPAMHAGTPVANTSIHKLSKVISAVHENYLGFSLCPISEAFVNTLVEKSGPLGAMYQALLGPGSFEAALYQIEDKRLAAQIKGIFCHTISPTRIGGGFALNVIPASAWVDLDCRVIPGTSSETFIENLMIVLEHTLGSLDGITCEVLQSEEGYMIETSDPLYKDLNNQLVTRWEDKLENAVGVPLLLPAMSDNRVYAQAGITPLGFAPLLFPAKFPGFTLAHAIDERMPVSAFSAGLEAYLDILGNLVTS